VSPDKPTDPPDDLRTGETPAEASESGGELLKQSELDALIAAFDQGETSTDEGSDAPADEAESSAQRSGGLLEQSELDALISAFEDKERRARDSAQTETPETPSETTAPAPSTSEPTTASSGPTKGDRGNLSQSDIETLIQQATHGEEDPPDPEDTTEAEPESKANAAQAEPVDTETHEAEERTGETEADSDIDHAFEELMAAAEPSEEGEPEAATWPKPPPAPVGDEAGQPEPAGEAETEAVDAEALEELNTPEAAIGGEMDDTLAGESATDAALVESDLDETASESGPVPQTQLDELLAAAEGDPSGGDDDTDSADGESAASMAATVPEPEDAAEIAEAALEGSEPEPDLREAVGSENVAAGAIDETLHAAAPRSEPRTEPPIPAATKPDTDASVDEPESERPGWLPPSPVELFRDEPWRAAVSLAAGVLVTVATVALLTAHPFRAPDSRELAFSAPGALERAVTLANDLLAAGRPGEALTLLDTALEAADTNDEGYDDARFARIEAVLASLPQTLSPERAAQVHTLIDDAVTTARAHPRAAEALLWKGEVYEREGNLIAARAEYRGILDNFAVSSVRDDALLELAEVELATERPLLAVDALQEIISDHPDSPHRHRARLLLGDAYAAAGDADAARGVYIRLAEQQMDTAIGGEAFERLGALALDEGDIGGAIRELEARLESATTVEGNDRVYLTLARAYRGRGELDKARNILNELVDFFPESDTTPLALAELSQVLAELDLEGEAVRLATRTAERYPKHPEVLRNAGDLLAQADEPGAAGRYTLSAYEAGAREPSLLLAAAKRFQEAGALEDAQEAYDRLIVEFPTTPQAVEATVGWAEAAQAQGDLSGAHSRLENLARATEGRPRQLPVLRALGRLYRDLGLETDAVNAFTQVTAITEDPAALAEAATELMRAGAVDEGLAIAARVDTAKLDGTIAYDLLTTQGATLLRLRPSRAVELLTEAHEGFPDARTSAGVRQLIDALLTLGRSAQARTLVAEMANRVQHPDHADERPLLHRAAAEFGDFLYERGDYRAAAEAYTIALGARPGEGLPAILNIAALSEVQLWSLYQRANALAAVQEHGESLALYEQLARANSPLAEDAKVRAAAVRMKQRMRGEDVPTTDRRAT